MRLGSPHREGATNEGSTEGRHPIWPWLSIGTPMGLVLVLGFGAPGLLLSKSTVCSLGSEVGTYSVWTLDTPLNKPPGVNVSVFARYGGWNFTFASGSLAFGEPELEVTGAGWVDASSGSGIAATADERNFTVFSVRNATVVGGFGAACTQPYVAAMLGPANQHCNGFITLPLANDSNDSLEPHVWNGTDGTGSGFDRSTCVPPTPGAYLWFDVSYDANGSGVRAPVTLNLCHSASSFGVQVSGIARVPIVLHVPIRGHDESIKGFQEWGTLTPGRAPVNYTIPSGWEWSLTPVGPISSPMDPSLPLPAMAAFERLNC